MSTVEDILNYARAAAQTDSNGLTDAKGLIFANEALVDFHRKLVAGGIDASQVQEVYRDAYVPSSGNGSTFIYPNDAMFLKAIEVNYTDTNPINYKRAEQLDVSNLPGGVSFGWLRLNASKEHPYFDDRGDWYEIFPTFTGSDNLSQAIRLFYFKKPVEYSSIADSLSYPVTLDYRILGNRVAADYLYSLEKQKSGDNLNLLYERGVNALIQFLSRGSQQPIQANGLNLTGWEF